MNVVDSSGWLEFFADGANAAFFAKPITDTRHLVVPTISLLPLADSVMLATARLHGAVLWTQDADFEAIEGVRYVGKTPRQPPQARG